MAFESHAILALYMNHKAWMMAQWNKLDEETQMEWMEKAHGEDEDDHDDHEGHDHLYALFGFHL